VAYPLPSPQPRPQGPPPGRAPSETDPDSPAGFRIGAPTTLVLIVLNVLVFFVQLAIARGGFVTMTAAALLGTGGNYWSATLHEGRGETLLTSCFVHAGLMHIGFNMVALRQIGPFVEKVAGGARMLPLYLISGVVGAFGSTFVHTLFSRSDNIGVGASGAICGLIGAALVIGWRVEGKNSPIVRGMARWLGTILLIGLLPGIDGSAHVFGAASGAVIAMLWRRGYVYSTFRRALVYGLSVAVVAAAGGLVVLHDLRDPYAMLTASDRLEVAQAALDRGDCVLARDAVVAAHRLIPHAKETNDAVAIVDNTCPR
jgi:rhomboid protease GluP